MLDFVQTPETLTNNTNPFAVIVSAHLTANQTRKNQQQRFRNKLSLTRRLYQQGFSRQDLLNLYRFIDWVMGLPQSLEQDFLEEIRQFEEENRMPYVTNAERFGLAKGLKQAQERETNFILRLINRRVGSIPSEVETQIRELPVDQLEDYRRSTTRFFLRTRFAYLVKSHPKINS